MTRNPPSLQALAASQDPFDRLDLLIERLLGNKKEGRHLEWKQHPPTGPTVTTRAKYRTVKAALAFANWEGGFVLFGVEPDGTWRGLDEKELSAVDPASITELINGCIFPDIPTLNYADFRHEGRLFAVLHVPPSPTAPHVTTKQVLEKDASGKIKTVLEKHALYCRQGAKCDLATPQQHQRIIAKRTEYLRDELLRRVKEVPVPFPSVSSTGVTAAAGSTLTIARLTADPNAPAVRVTRQEGASGILLHEELSDGLFEEINNVVDANTLLAGGRKAFVLGEGVYHRIYAERQHIDPTPARLELLACTGLHDFYAPNLFWLLRLPAAAVAALMHSAADDMKSPQVWGLIRLAVLLGEPAVDWLWRRMHRSWGSHSQAPDYYWSFKQMRTRKVTDARLSALRISGAHLILVPGGSEVKAEALLSNPTEAAAWLSKSCIEVFSGRKEFRQAARYLDVLAYGLEIATLSSAIIQGLEQ